MSTQEDRKTILLVEDEALIAVMEKQILNKHGFNVITVSNGEKAIEIIYTTPSIDLILMDINLGGGKMDGTKAAEIILKEHNIPILFLSSYAQPEVVQKTEKISSYGYVTKDSGETVLLASIKMAFKLFEANERTSKSEEMFSAAFTTSPYAITITLAEDGQFVTVNDAFYTITGYTREEALMSSSIGLDLWVNEEDRNRVVQELMSGHKVVNQEYLFKKKTGEIITGLFSAELKRIKSEDIILSSINDITDRKKAKEALQESETKYRTLFEMESDALFLIDAQSGNILDANFAAVALYGYSFNELLGMKNVDLSAEPEKTIESSTLASASGIVVIPFRYHRKKDGTIFPVEINATFLVRNGRQIFIPAIRDITERKQAEELFHNAHRRLESIIEGTHVGTWEWNVQTGETVFNEVWTQIIGYTLDELSPISIKTWETFVHPDDLRQSAELLEQHFAGELPYYDCECRMKHKDGHWVWVHDRGRVITRTDDGKPLMMFGTHTDISNRKQAEEARDRLNTELAAKNAELEQVFFVASHDLRSPLVNIDGYGKELEHAVEDLFRAFADRDRIPAEVRETVASILEHDIPDALRFIRTSTAKMDALLAGLLRLSRSGRAALSIGPLNMNQLVSKVVDETGFQIKEAGIELILTELPPCTGDAVQVNQVFSNLLNNAMKFLDPQRPGVIRISGTIQGERSVYCVEDNGIGIAPAHQKIIFEIFHRLEPGKSAGEGLGLTIVKRVLNRLTGEVWVESEPGVGSRFYVELPVA